MTSWEWGYLEGVQSSGVWASSRAVEMWGDRFLLFWSWVWKREGNAPHLGIRSPLKGSLCFSSPPPHGAEALP